MKTQLGKGANQVRSRRGSNGGAGVCACIVWFFLLVAPTLVAATPAGAARLQRVPADNPDYIYAGRVDFADPAAPKFYWAGNSATIGFTGRQLAVVLDDPAGGAWFDIIIDGDGPQRHAIHCRKGRHVYVVATHLAATRHVAEVFRRVDPTVPGVAFDGIRVARGATVFRPRQHHALKIVYYGDSITSGYGVLDSTRKDEGKMAHMDNYMAYDAVAARELNATYRAISLSGIGITKSWFPLTMPRMYDRLVPRDPASRWDFSRWTPNIVVVNLLQNDSWLLPREKHPPTPQQIIRAYASFVGTLRSHDSGAIIICMLGNMDVTAKGSPWPGYVRAAVRRMRMAGDDRVYALTVPYKETPGHPNVAEQRSLAQALVNRITVIKRDSGSTNGPSESSGGSAGAH